VRAIIYLLIRTVRADVRARATSRSSDVNYAPRDIVPNCYSHCVPAARGGGHALLTFNPSPQFSVCRLEMTSGGVCARVRGRDLPQAECDDYNVVVA